MEHELMVLLASAMEKDQIIDRIEQAISNYREAKLLADEKQIEIEAHHIALACNLFMMNIVTDGNINGAMDVIKKVKTMRDREKIFDVSDKQN
jgi:hypothetical protein